jgi:prepilin-type N-terminal cleavage/methylation domain-containing protein
MRSDRGYTLIEMLIALGLIAVVSGIAIPVFMSSNAMNALWTNSERIGAIIRQTRLKAITQNATYELRFDCPSENQLRALIVDADIGEASRCEMDKTGDSEIIEMNPGVAFDPGDVTALSVTGRGVFTSVGGAIPMTISVTYGEAARYLTVSATGQITFSETAPVVE